MRIKQSILICFGISLILLIMSAGTAVAAEPPEPAIEIEKSTNGVDADTAPGPDLFVGNPVLWEYVVTNTGNVPLENIDVIDDQGVTVTCPQTTLAVGQSMTCTATGTAAAGQYTNLGTATATDAYGNSVTDDDRSNYVGIEKTEIPEFPTIALPVIAVLGLAFIFQRRRN
jgi:hypothetical protein